MPSPTFEIHSKENSSSQEPSPAELLANEAAAFADHYSDFNEIQKRFNIGDLGYQIADDLGKVCDSTGSRLSSLSVLLMVYGGTSEHPRHAFYRECVLDELRMVSLSTESDILSTKNALVSTGDDATAAKAASMKDELTAVFQLLNLLQDSLP
jgi:hypothetical protein